MPSALQQTGNVTLDASGNGSVTLYPRGQDWVITLTSVSTSTAVKQATATVSVSGTFVEGTWSGALDNSDSRHVVQVNDTLTAEWMGGDPGALATITIRGLACEPGTGLGYL